MTLTLFDVVQISKSMAKANDMLYPASVHFLKELKDKWFTRTAYFYMLQIIL